MASELEVELAGDAVLLCVLQYLEGIGLYGAAHRLEEDSGASLWHDASRETRFLRDLLLRGQFFEALDFLGPTLSLSLSLSPSLSLSLTLWP
mmetsp:Transcript_38706/g.121313  ORF Transcript_38706/g.121313 Transcript_38706/m.121313 type:complete len:92 (+) Transcript_38706:180-455(+)